MDEMDADGVDGLRRFEESVPYVRERLARPREGWLASRVFYSRRSELRVRPSAKHFAGLFQGVDKNRLRFLESPPAAAAAAGDVEVDDAETVEVEPIEVVDGREAVAHLRNLRGSPNKVRRVLDAIRGLSYEEALMALEFMPYRACDDILKVLYSAAANAKNNMGLNKSKLYISQCWCDPGKLLKRPRPRARGRADVVKKPGCHITMYVKERQ
mmetsp:Transcript_3645/g.9147  ORF Transcript_3645/g.9147 Transcript_3645/m.9147 type:complete len:213 (+) Transcript_3645:180-818(+)